MAVWTLWTAQVRENLSTDYCREVKKVLRYRFIGPILPKVQFVFAAPSGALAKETEMSDHKKDSISLGWGFYGCRNSAALRDPQLGEVLNDFLLRAGFTVYSHGVHVFPGEGGASATAIIGESSADFHAWPEAGSIHIRIFYCQFSGNNDAKAESFYWLCKGHFYPEKVLTHKPDVFPLQHPDMVARA